MKTFSYLFITTLFCCVTLSFLSGCKLDDPTGPQTVIYTAGYTENDVGIAVPCYWKNNTRIDLPAVKNGRVHSIQVVFEF